jgi:hypothetical protein
MIVPYAPSVEKALCRLFNSLGEREQRLYAAAETLKLGHGGLLYVSRLFECDQKTIRRGIRELQESSFLPPGRSRKKGAGGNHA